MIEIPEINFSLHIDGYKESRVYGGPLHIIHIIRVSLKGTQWSSSLRLNVIIIIIIIIIIIMMMMMMIIIIIIIIIVTTYCNLLFIGKFQAP